MNQKEKAGSFRGCVRKLVSPVGVISWVSEIRTATTFRNLGQAHSVGEAIALVIETAPSTAPAAEAQALRQAA